MTQASSSATAADVSALTATTAAPAPAADDLGVSKAAAAAAAAGATPASATLAATGQLSEGEFMAAARLFCAWWQHTHPEGPQWRLQSVVLPVTEQVLEYAQLERVVVVGSTAGPDSLPDAAAAALPKPQQQQQQADDADIGSSSACPSDGDSSCGDVLEGCWDEATALDGGQAHSQQQQPTQQQAQQQPQRQLHRYSIVWHDIYRVPVLYLEACHEDGQPVSLSSLFQGLPRLAAYQEEEEGATTGPSWTYLTATAHPATGAPCFMLHPCQTAVRMQLLLQGHQELRRNANDAEEGSSEQLLLLVYLQAWCSMVAPLLGLAVRW